MMPIGPPRQIEFLFLHSLLLFGPGTNCLKLGQEVFLPNNPDFADISSDADCVVECVFLCCCLQNIWISMFPNNGFTNSCILDFQTSNSLDFPTSNKSKRTPSGGRTDGQADGTLGSWIWKLVSSTVPDCYWKQKIDLTFSCLSWYWTVASCGSKSNSLLMIPQFD